MEVPRIGGSIADSRCVARLCPDRFIVGRGWKPDPTINGSAYKHDARHREVPPNRRLHRRFEMARLGRDRFIVGCGWKPNPTIIKKRQSGRHC
jgi:hypothetical protein